MNDRSYGEISLPDTDITFVSSGRSSTDRLFPSLHNNLETGFSNPRLSYSSDTDGNYNYSFESIHYGRRSMDIGTPDHFSSFSHDSEGLSSSTPQTMVRDRATNVHFLFPPQPVHVLISSSLTHKRAQKFHNLDTFSHEKVGLQDVFSLKIRSKDINKVLWLHIK